MKKIVRCDKCTKCLGAFEKAVGEIQCPGCGHLQAVDFDFSINNELRCLKKGDISMAKTEKHFEVSEEKLWEIDTKRTEAMIVLGEIQAVLELGTEAALHKSTTTDWVSLMHILNRSATALEKELSDIDEMTTAIYQGDKNNCQGEKGENRQC